jgi:uncharacterized protein YdaU (DUF1376 family)
MNHYPHHVGDFNSATRHLTFVERALYRELLDLYYDTERPLIADETKLARRVLANTEELREALRVVLDEFFVLDEDGWHNDRCDREIAAYQAKQEQQSRAGRASAAKRAGDGGGAAPAAKAPQSGPSGGVDAVERPLNDRSTNQNQNQNHIKPPNPPAGGASDSGAVASVQGKRTSSAAQAPAATATVTATALCAFFPEIRRTRLAEVASCIASLEADGTVTGEQLLKAAAQQSEHLCRDDGKACPSVLRWLREQRWLDAAAGVGQAGSVPSDWRQTRSGVEAMGERLGLGRWDQERHRLFTQYEDAVVAALEGQTVGA